VPERLTKLSVLVVEISGVEEGGGTDEDGRELQLTATSSITIRFTSAMSCMLILLCTCI